MARRNVLLLPGDWTKSVRTGVLHAISPAFVALTRAWSSGATSHRRTTRRWAALDRANTEIALLEEELSIKNARGKAAWTNRLRSCWESSGT